MFPAIPVGVVQSTVTTSLPMVISGTKALESEKEEKGTLQLK